MAFRQPTLHAPQQRHPAPQPQPLPLQTTTTPRAETQNTIDSQEWILFSPSTTSSTARTRTAHLSHSHASSLETAARSYGYDLESTSTSTSSHDQAVGEEEDGELDSLDSHLLEFRSPSIYNPNPSPQDEAVLPVHDGLGSFRVERTMMGQEVQEQLYAFERYNPRRISIKRRRESEVEDEERTRRIERWREEQGRVLVGEIERETRRRGWSVGEREVEREEDVVTMSSVTESSHENENENDTGDNESFWSRITRRVIRDLMGADDELLSIIFGESLPTEDDLSTTPQAKNPSPLDLIPTQPDPTWESRLLSRIARELGILVSQLSEHPHPGAFSTYLQTTTQPLPYAGLPVIPETQNQNQQQSATQMLDTPTLPVPIPKAEEQLAREEWERELDIKLVFRYLRTRFSSSPPASSSSPTAQILSPPADDTARAARVRMHHPLVAKQRTWKVSVPGGRDVGIGRRGSSCGSEKARKSSMGSSRHYWDFGAGGGGSLSGVSVGSGGVGGMGSWGEV